MKDHKIRAVIWDIGGVLVRTVDREPRARMAQRLGLTRDELVYLVFDSEMGQQAQSGQISALGLWEYVCQVLHLLPEDIPALEREFFGGDALDVELVDYIRGLRLRYLTGIISNAWDNVRQAIQDRWHMADAFDHIVLSAEVRLSKPDPRIFQASLQGLGVEPSEAVFIDDYLPNVVGARHVGMQAIQFRDSEKVRIDLNQLLSGDSLLGQKGQSA